MAHVSDPIRSPGGIFRRQPEEEQSPVGGECYACTQVRVPVFHSTSCCDEAHQPEWEASAGSYLFPMRVRQAGPAASGVQSIRSGVLDPRSKLVQRWNRAFLLARGVALAVDPLYFYTLSIGCGGSPCLHVDRRLATAVTTVRTCVDAVHLLHLLLQFRLAYVSRESLVSGCGKLVWDSRAVAGHYFRSLKGFWLDIFVILPFPQVMFWTMVPGLIKEQRIKLVVTILLLIFLFQFLPKVYHSICLMKNMQKVTGYIFGTIWWGFALNLIAYFIASHVAGGCWYALAIQRVASCIRQHCGKSIGSCDLSMRNSCDAGKKSTLGLGMQLCLDVNGPFRYGIYQCSPPIVSSSSVALRILYPAFWGLSTFSTFGNNLEPTSQGLEVLFSICAVLSGLMLFTLLIGNIQVFLHAVMAKKRKMQLRCRDMEWWMKRRQLPTQLRKRVRRSERHQWTALGSEEEVELIKDFPEGLRRDIKRFLCLDLIKKVPLFHSLDDLILDNICDRVRPLVFSKDEKIIREGDPVQRMVFIVTGCVKSSQNLSRGMVASSLVEPGGFFGDELFSWCLRRPLVDRLPASSATFTCLDPTEAFVLDANDLRYITEHFRYKFANEKLKQKARYYSCNWRTWAAVNIQLGWRRYKQRMRNESSFSPASSDNEKRLRQYATFFLSIRPHDHLE